MHTTRAIKDRRLVHVRSWGVAEPEAERIAISHTVLLNYYERDFGIKCSLCLILIDQQIGGWHCDCDAVYYCTIACRLLANPDHQLECV